MGMQTMERRLSNGNHNNKYSYFCNNNNGYHYYCEDNGVGGGHFWDSANGGGGRDRTCVVVASNSSISPSSSSSLPPTDYATTFTPDSPVNGVGFIEHPVSKLDTLAGVAIKYGVEVADIRKMNGLTTDLQMFALKSLQIPLPGRHPPSPSLTASPTPANEQTPPHRVNSDFFDSFHSLRLKSSQRKVSPAMSSLQGYYGLNPADTKENSLYSDDSHRTSPASHPPLNRHRKSRSSVSVDELLDEINGVIADNEHHTEGRESESEKLVRRRPKSEADFMSSSTELLMREQNNGNGSAFSAITGKGLALRQKAGSRTALQSDAEARGLSTGAQSQGEAPVVDVFSSVRKSSSASNLQDQDSSLSSIWPTAKWSLKPDLPALSAAAITRPIFDGLPKPITGWRNKAALD